MIDVVPELLMLKELVSKMPQPDQEFIKDLRKQIKDLVAANGDNGFLAMAIVSAELADSYGE